MARKEAEAPPLLYITLKPTLVNGARLAGFGDAEFYPGEKIQVRGESGLQFHHALKLVNTGNCYWCNAEGQRLDEDPEPTPEEKEALPLSGSLNLRGIPEGGVVDFHKVDRNYKPGGQKIRVRAEDLPQDVTGANEALETPQPELPTLPVSRTSSARREANTGKQAEGEDNPEALKD